MRIALCGYLGSGCTEVAEILASKFGLDTFNTSVIIESIKDLKSFGTSGEIDLDTVIKSKLEEILKRDNVIIEGRSAFMLLDKKDVIKIFLSAPLEERIKHVAQRRGVSAEKAREDVIKSDIERNHLIQRLLNTDCLNIINYDFTINTSSKTFSRIAETISQIIKTLAH